MLGIGVSREQPIRFRPPLLARLMAVAYLALATWLVYAMVRELVSTGVRSTADVVFVLLFTVVLGGGLVVYLTWLAARLWWHFSAATVRWGSATAVAISAFVILEVVDRCFALAAAMPIQSVLAVALLVIGAVAYRRLSRWIIARSGLEDPTDLLGQYVGHSERVKAFCVVLGWAVWLAASNLTRDALIARRDGWSLLLGVSPIAIGWLTYRVVLWSMTPRTRAALPPGGFPVLPPPQKDVA